MQTHLRVLLRACPRNTSAALRCTAAVSSAHAAGVLASSHLDSRLAMQAVYVLGSEDAGLPPSVVRACHLCVSLEGLRAASYNVAVAGSILMYDRHRKLGGAKDVAVLEGGERVDAAPG